MDCCISYVTTEEKNNWPPQQTRTGLHLESYLQQCADFIRDTFDKLSDNASLSDEVSGDLIIKILLRRDFNYQSFGRVAHLMPELSQRLSAVVRERRPLPIYFLYHGGYRASHTDVLEDLVFAPDATELLLLYQVARLQRALTPLYPPGISFSIVLNNGVAAFTNDIPYRLTEAYAARLKHMIQLLGADTEIEVLVQSSLNPAAKSLHTMPDMKAVAVDEIGHKNIERFLGRVCLADEATLRATRYAAAEAAWAKEMKDIVDQTSGFCMRQIAHPSCLSFRPFQGGAIRAQNGSVGFAVRADEGDPVPFLVTSNTASRRELLTIPVCWDDVLLTSVHQTRRVA